MKVQREQLKPSNLNTQIEIIRDNKNTDKDPFPPPVSQGETALNALAELVERLESLEALSLVSSTSSVESEACNSQKEDRERYMKDVHHYLNLFQKQSAVLRRLSSKLN